MSISDSSEGEEGELCGRNEYDKEQIEQTREWEGKQMQEGVDLCSCLAALEKQLAEACQSGADIESLCQLCRQWAGQLEAELASLRARVEELEGGPGPLREERGTQTEESKSDWEAGQGVGLAEQVREAAAGALELQGMVWEETSGLYYHTQSGYYFDAERSLYYCGQTGTWYQYDETAGEYRVHSNEPEEEVRAAQLLQAGAGSVERGEATIPCIRLVVQRSDDPEVRPGSLAGIITCTGGTIGRAEGQTVMLEGGGCSKHHASITWREGRYWLRDLGSRNGTWLAGRRLSVSKVESKEVEVGHGSRLQLGTTHLLCHVHPGRETCLECEPGAALPVQQEDVGAGWDTGLNTTRERDRKAGVKQLKRKYGLDNPGEVGGNAVAAVMSGYQDRARERRQVVGSAHHSQKTLQASQDEAIPRENKGAKLLAKMGWQGGGLGKQGQGRAEPVAVRQRPGKAGLGSDIPLVETSKAHKAKADIWIKTQKRFLTAPVLEEFGADSDEETPVI